MIGAIQYDCRYGKKIVSSRFNPKKKMKFETMAALKLDPQIQYNDDKKNELFFAFNRKITSARHIRAADGHACKFH